MRSEAELVAALRAGMRQLVGGGAAVAASPRRVLVREYHGDRPCLPPDAMMRLMRRLGK